uniref:protein-tyrosine-phosphatase n=1 Tax=Oryctolagus cuniculus TaxID=9986 RepID=A0A5F9CKX9_RABIT
MSRSLDAARNFLEQLEERGGWEGAVLAGEFSDIQARSAAWKRDRVCTAEAGSLPGNAKKNRYKDVLPYDRTRVILSLLQEEGHGDYINGNFIRGADGSRAYIATQGPLPHTLQDFWRLVWEFRVKKKCERYWAQEQEPLQIGPFCITLAKEARLNSDIVHRTLQVTFKKESRSVHQLQYTSWPDRGVPSSSDNVLTMVEEARRLHGPGPGPLCIHCSAGCGRTGVLCTVDYVRQLLLTKMIPPNFSLSNVVLELRKQRPSAVQTEEQYRFLYHTVAQMFRSALQRASPRHQDLKENCSPVYAEVDSLRKSPALLGTAPRPAGEVLRSISVPGAPTLAMAHTYAVVQKRGAPAGAGPGARTGDPEGEKLYSQVTPRALRSGAHSEDARRPMPAQGESSPVRGAGRGDGAGAGRHPPAPSWVSQLAGLLPIPTPSPRLSLGFPLATPPEHLPARETRPQASPSSVPSSVSLFGLCAMGGCSRLGHSHSRRAPPPVCLPGSLRPGPCRGWGPTELTCEWGSPAHSSC